MEDGEERSATGIARLLAFSDGVFAIAFTILVLDLEVPAGLSAPELLTALRGQLPHLLSTGLSFAVIGRFWLSHHGLFRHVRVADRTLLLLNTVLMAPIALIPSATGLLAEYGDLPIAVIVYSAAVGAAALGQLGVWLWATRRRRLGGRKLSDAGVLGMTLGLAGAAVAFLVAIPVAPLSTTAAKLCWLIALVPTDPIAAWWYARTSR
jgi:uncharacterized membrane protein